MTMRLPILLSIVVALATACGPAKIAESAELKKVFPASASPQDPNQAAILAMVNKVDEAEKKQEYAEAAGALMVLRSQKDISVEQRMAVQDAMGRLQTSLAQRADSGDPQAIAALQAIRAMKSR